MKCPDCRDGKLSLFPDTMECFCDTCCRVYTQLELERRGYPIEYRKNTTPQRATIGWDGPQSVIITPEVDPTSAVKSTLEQDLLEKTLSLRQS